MTKDFGQVRASFKHGSRRLDTPSQDHRAHAHLPMAHAALLDVTAPPLADVDERSCITPLVAFFTCVPLSALGALCSRGGVLGFVVLRLRVTESQRKRRKESERADSAPG